MKQLPRWTRRRENWFWLTALALVATAWIVTLACERSADPDDYLHLQRPPVPPPDTTFGPHKPTDANAVFCPICDRMCEWDKIGLRTIVQCRCCGGLYDR